MIENAKTKLAKYPKVSIGLPVYNGEKFLHKRIESLLCQNYSDFEIIISDNASTDSTPNICQEFLKKDKRIRYYRQEKNIGGMNNFNFVLEKAKGEYFVWAAADDMWEPDFLKDNVEILIKNKNLVGCVSKEKILPLEPEDLEAIQNYSKTRKYLRMKLFSLRPNLYPISGSYSKKVKSILWSKSSNMLYGVMRTDALQKSITKDRFLGDEWSIMLNIVRYGDFYEIEKPMLLRTEHGVSWSGMIDLVHKFNHSFWDKVFPNYPLTRWCAKNLGAKVFLKNLDQIIWLNIEMSINMIFEVLLLTKNKLVHKKT